MVRKSLLLLDVKFLIVSAAPTCPEKAELN